MSSKNWAILWVLGANGAAMALAHAGEPAPQLNVKLGLWEIGTHPQVSGNLPIGDEQLQKMPPEQRAKFEAAMQAALARGAQPRLFKECMTPEKRSRGFNAGSDEGKDCKTTVLTNTASEFQAQRECSGEDRAQSTDVHFRVVSPDHVTGTVLMVMSRDGKTMTVNSTMEGKWLGSDCGSVKDVELEKAAP
jgi:hypothetical protein